MYKSFPHQVSVDAKNERICCSISAFTESGTEAGYEKVKCYKMKLSKTEMKRLTKMMRHYKRSADFCVDFTLTTKKLINHIPALQA